MVLVEAMALGIPLIAADVPGPADIIEHGISGLLVPAGDSHALATEIGRLVDDGALAGALAQAARERAREFTEDAMVRQFAALVDDVIPGPR